ncbi:MAG TPA: hypothetical protein VGY97_07455 [Solirubrobacteraceae bacterium]|jgi:predicted lipoprotein with Yx(FWY)xxD motif|nr:hypothetical protein [Solirubrobacteraceae bacterium]
MRRIAKLFVPAVAASLLLAACGGGSYGSGSGSGATNATVKTAPNAGLGGTILVTAQGLTLYRLTAERNGRFICTSACLQLWHPLSVAAGAKPTGIASLGTIMRPDGSDQVTFQNLPLYTFAQDQNPGDTNGQGVRDVGTWSAIVTRRSSGATPAPAPAPRRYGY